MYLLTYITLRAEAITVTSDTTLNITGTHWMNKGSPVF